MSALRRWWRWNWLCNRNDWLSANYRTYTDNCPLRSDCQLLSKVLSRTEPRNSSPASWRCFCQGMCIDSEARRCLDFLSTDRQLCLIEGLCSGYFSCCSSPNTLDTALLYLVSILLMKQSSESQSARGRASQRSQVHKLPASAHWLWSRLMVWGYLPSVGAYVPTLASGTYLELRVIKSITVPKIKK